MTLWESCVEMERLRNRYADSVLDKQQEYGDKCAERFSELCEEFEELKRKHENLFEEEMWKKIEGSIEDSYYSDNFEPDITLSYIIESYIEDGKMWDDWEELYPEPTSFREKEFERNSEKLYRLL